jgi:hypothetical protein
MPFSFEDVLYGFLLPSIVAMLGTIVFRRVLPGDMGDRYGASIGFAVALFSGYRMLDLGPWMPEKHWHWLPHSVTLAAIFGSAASAAGVRWLERFGLYIAVTFIAAWHLVPTWEHLDPSRRTYLAVWTLCVAVIASLIYRMPRSVPSALQCSVLAVTCACGAVVLILSGNLRFGQIAGIGAGACMGIAIASAFVRQEAVRNYAALPVAVFLSGAMLIGRVNSFSEVPLVSYVLVPLSPLMLWGLAVGPLAKLPGIQRTIAGFVIGVALAGVATAVALIAEPIESDEYSEYDEYGEYGDY